MLRSPLPGPTPRRVEAIYADPLDTLWLGLATGLGVRVARSPEVNVAWDGAGLLTIGTSETLDADDCLAQLLFHELCHAVVEGPASWALPDWGLVNTDERHLVREQATLRLQAAWAEQHGLRRLLAATTDHRAYYDALPADPLAPDGDPATPLAQSAFARRLSVPPLGPAVDAALRDTAALAHIVRPYAPPDSLWRR